MKAWKRRAVEAHNAKYKAAQEGKLFVPQQAEAEVVEPTSHEDNDIVAVGIDPGGDSTAVTTVARDGRIGVICGGYGITGAGRSMARVYRDAALRKAVEFING